MSKVIRLCVLASLLYLPLNVSSQEQCSKINCDCNSLPTTLWVQACKSQEAKIALDCVKQKENELSFCSIHGPLANRLPLDLDLKETQRYSLEEVGNLNNRVAVLYWEIMKDFRSFEGHLNRVPLETAKKKLDSVEGNVDALFTYQRQVGNSLISDKRDALAQLAWREYSADTLSFGSDFLIRAESLLNSYDEFVNEETREEVRGLGLRLMKLSGKVYEQIGYAYSNGMRHKHAAKAWKNAADASALVLAHSAGESRASAYYRFQSAARLHRASYHWVIGGGRGGAEESLAESQKFMDDASSISGLVEEQREFRASQPFWQK